MSNSGSIGVFDSGYGGLTVFREIVKELPQYNYIYLGDNARVPYGSRSFETVYQYTWQCVQALFNLGCPLVVLACNTASSKALRSIQIENLPQYKGTKNVLGVIRPTTEKIGEYTKTRHVGVLATPGTVKSDSYRIEIDMKILIVNGPNLNLLGKREPTVYGSETFESYLSILKESYPKHDISYFQSNSEGDIIDKIHEVGFLIDGIIINAGAYTHTSLAIADAIAAVTTPVIEVHISNVFARETVRHHSFIAKNCKGSISGFGFKSYRLAIESLLAD